MAGDDTDWEAVKARAKALDDTYLMLHQLQTQVVTDGKRLDDSEVRGLLIGLTALVLRLYERDRYRLG